MINQFEDQELQKAIIANQWTYGQLFPEIISPGPMPIRLKYKTHTFSSRFSDTVNVWDSTSYNPETNEFEEYPERKGKMWVYFAPTNDLLLLSGVLGTDFDTLNENAIFYSSSNGPLPYSAFDTFDYREITLNNSSKKNIGLTGYKKLRVTSAAICIKQIGPEIERSGIIKIGMSYKGAIESVPSIKFDKFQNYFNISDVISLSDSAEVICRYRLPKHLLDKYAPFDPTTNLPYFFIYGEGISPKMSFEIEIIRHFEGIILPEYSSFHNPIIQSKQTPFNIQNETIRTIEKDSNIIQNIRYPKINNMISRPGKMAKMQHYREHAHNPLEPMKTDTDLSAYELVLKKTGQKITEVGENFKEKVKESAINKAKEGILKAITKVVPVKAKSKLKSLLDKYYDTEATFEENVSTIVSKIAEKASDYSLNKAERAYDLFLNKFV